eukprot:c16689_g1_i1.p1 GENE.c16689_g1_i1~~c16689_g1_i1.p1  ORF type:complete len:283 (-),score=70.32 c16689_g1_i1:70-918(-)
MEEEEWLSEAYILWSYIFAGLYTIVLILLLTSLASEWQQFYKRLIHLLLIFAVVCRITVLIAEPILKQDKHSDIEQFLEVIVTIGDFTFLLTFFLMVLLWAAIDRRTRQSVESTPRTDSMPNKQKKILTCVYIYLISEFLITGSVYACFLYADDSISQIADRCLYGFIATLNFICSFSYIFYGSRLLFSIWEMPKESRRSSRVMNQVTQLTVVCSLCFLVRAALQGFQVNCPDCQYIEAQNTYFAVGEIFPILCVILGSKIKTRIPFLMGYSSSINETPLIR